MDKLLPSNGGYIRWEIMQNDGNKDRGNVQPVVRISIDEKQYLKIPVFVTIRTYEDIAGPNKKIDRHDILTMDDLVVKRMETTKLAGITFDNIEDLIGKRAIRPILPNIPIIGEMIDNPPLIKKGDFIKGSVQSCNLYIVTKGVAKEDGYRGKVIRIKNTESNE